MSCCDTGLSRWELSKCFYELMRSELRVRVPAALNSGLINYSSCDSIMWQWLLHHRKDYGPVDEFINQGYTWAHYVTICFMGLLTLCCFAHLLICLIYDDKSTQICVCWMSNEVW